MRNLTTRPLFSRPLSSRSLSSRFLRTLPLLAILPGLLMTSAVLAGPAGETQASGAANDLATPPKDAERTPSGLASKVLTPGTGKLHPGPTDIVAVHFIGRTPDGDVFNDSHQQGKPVVFNLSKVFKGWQEGIQLMVVGEKRRLWIPGHLAPQNPKAGPSGPVIFDVELFAIKTLPRAPTHLEEPPSDAVRTPSGAFTKLLEEGTGTDKPTFEDSVLVHYTGWTTDGKVFDSTIERGRPTMFPLDRVMHGFAECMQQMVVGEKRNFWIPAHLAGGQWPGSPQGMLVFEVQLLNVADTAQILQDGPIPKDES